MERIASAEAFERAGCFDCLVAAYGIYDALRSNAQYRSAATAGAFRTTTLLEIRHREIGMAEAGHAARASALAADGGLDPDAAGQLAAAGELPGHNPAVRRPANTPAPWRTPRAARGGVDAARVVLEEDADRDALSAYLWLGLPCADGGRRTALDAVGVWRDAPLILFKAATCGDIDGAGLERLLSVEPRFVEANYLLGLAALARADVDEAIRRLRLAYAWQPEWPVVTYWLAHALAAAEDFEPAVALFDETLALQPEAPDALLEAAHALLELGRHEDSIATVDRLLALGAWYPGDARYLRALNGLQLGRFDEAWQDVEEARRSMQTAAVERLSGIVAYHRRQLDVARARLTDAHARDPRDCEAPYFLGIVLVEQQAWLAASDVLVQATTCLSEAVARLEDEIANMRAAADPSRARIARRERLLTGTRRMLVVSSSNSARARAMLTQRP